MQTILRDDTLLQVTHLDPWYANIVNFIVTVYVPPEKTKGDLWMRVDITCGMSLTFTESVPTDFWWDVSHHMMQPRSSRNAIPHHMEATMESSEFMQNSGEVVSYGQPCMKIEDNSSWVALNFKGMGISMHEIAKPLTSNLQVELFDVWGIDYMGPLPNLEAANTS